MRLLGSHLGRTWRAVREDDVAARSLRRRRSTATRRWPSRSAASAPASAAAITAHLYSYINYETFNAQLSILALTMVILGGIGNVVGRASLGAVLLVGLPELFRAPAEYRVLIYGVVLLLLIRFRPQGLLGTV